MPMYYVGFIKGAEYYSCFLDKTALGMPFPTVPLQTNHSVEVIVGAWGEYTYKYAEGW